MERVENKKMSEKDKILLYERLKSEIKLIFHGYEYEQIIRFVALLLEI